MRNNRAARARSE